MSSYRLFTCLLSPDFGSSPTCSPIWKTSPRTCAHNRLLLSQSIILLKKTRRSGHGTVSWRRRSSSRKRRGGEAVSLLCFLRSRGRPVVAIVYQRHKIHRGNGRKRKRREAATISRSSKSKPKPKPKTHVEGAVLRAVLASK